jgi:hypothetical protein
MGRAKLEKNRGMHVVLDESYLSLKDRSSVLVVETMVENDQWQ